ncbi:unnamed protein product [Paramecium pentaurelia]|uniref:Uncharacterized protein n=1 Tax=Paramecium pentaurelia TaxID=43138 RepID=A0A8S1TP61_9CILI|nr:unnamed protein product [Paramecium pentaurelia]
MEMNTWQNQNDIADSETIPLQSEPLMGAICQRLHQICTTSIQIRRRIIQKRRRNAIQNSRDQNKIENSKETKQCLSQLMLIEQLCNDLQYVKELVSLIE